MADLRQGSRYGSRKFIVTLVVLITATFLRYLELIDGADWIKVAVAALGLYSLANVAQKQIDKEPAKDETPAP